jgi:CHAT domain-containing protein
VAWCVTRQGLAAVKLPSRERLEAAARQLSAQLSARNEHRPGEDGASRLRRILRADAAVGPAAEQLARLVLAPLAPHLARQRLVIVPDGALSYVPFAMLPDPSDPDRAPLIERHEVTHLPSASVLAPLRARERPAAERGVAVIADPVFEASDERMAGTGPATAPAREVERHTLLRLPFSRLEAEAISAASATPLDLLTGFAAHREAVLDGRFSRHRILHLATHGVIDTQQPELSGLVLSRFDASGRPRDGLLLLPDVFDLELSADLVVLSGCRTALGPHVRGEGLVGLVQGFLYAGAPRVLASLWSVQDRATAEWMRAFYDGLLRDGLRPAAAARAAQRRMRRQPGWETPYHWAGFVLQGEWR